MSQIAARPGEGELLPILAFNQHSRQRRTNAPGQFVRHYLQGNVDPRR